MEEELVIGTWGFAIGVGGVAVLSCDGAVLFFLFLLFLQRLLLATSYKELITTSDFVNSHLDKSLSLGCLIGIFKAKLKCAFIKYNKLGFKDWKPFGNTGNTFSKVFFNLAGRCYK